MTSPAVRRTPVLLILAIVIGGVGVDQITKALAVTYLTPGQPVRLISDLLQFQLLRNPGAAFGTGTSWTLAFAILAVLALGALSVWVVPRVKVRIWGVTVGLGLAGIAGNLVDRIIREPGVFRGHVIDFMALKYFAVFNVADIALTAAAVMVIMNTLILKVELSGEPLVSVAKDEPTHSEPETAIEAHEDE